MKKGFTLIELLIVISIIGILAVALLPSILSAPATARDVGRKNTLNDVVIALESYKSTANDYPSCATGTSCALPASLTDYFKGKVAPVGFTGASTSVLGTTGTGANVMYCRAATNTLGYSYIVAIRMEQKQYGANALAPLTACTTAPTAAGANFSAGTTGSDWYFIIQ